MSVFTAAIYNRLRNDATLVAMLSTYNGRPAIFTVDPVPGDAVLPYIVAVGHVADAPWDTKTSRGRNILRDIRCYAEATGSMALVESMAERVRILFHRQKIPVEGYDNVMTTCTGPIIGPADGSVYGLIVTVRFVLEEVA
jgi:hypothetical protein